MQRPLSIPKPMGPRLSRAAGRPSLLLMAGALLVFPAQGLAATGQLLVLGTGECQSPELRTASRVLHEALATNVPTEDSTAETVLQQLRPLPAQSLEDVQRQLESARTHFYDGKLGQAESQIAAALTALEHLPPAEERWALAVELRLLRYLTLQAQRNPDAVSSFHEVLRLAPRYKPDPNYYSPGTRKAFERARKQVAGMPRGKLTVTSSPSGAEVFLDGKRVGRTPLTFEAVPGAYQVQVEKEGATSFSRSVQVQDGRVATVGVDLAFEGSVVAGQPPCVQARADGADPLRGVLKLAALLGVSDVVAVRVLRASAGPGTVTALLLNLESGQVVREGSLKLTPTGDLGEGSADLATFIRTGKASRGIQVKQAAPEVAGPAVSQSGASAAVSTAPASEDRPIASVPAVEAPHAVQAAATAPSSGPSFLRLTSYGVAGLGTAALAGAAAVWATSQSDVKQLSGRLHEGALVEGDAEGRRLYLQLQDRSRLTTGLLVGGGVGLAAGAAMFLLSAPTPALSVSVHPTPEGAAAHLMGSF